MHTLLAILLSILLLGACATEQSKEDVGRAMLHFQIGSAHLTQGNYPSALRELLVAERLHPKGPEIQNNLGLAYFVRNEYKIAEEKFRKALEFNSEFTEARNNLGRVLVEQKLYKEAIKELQLATKDLLYQYPDRSFTNLGLAYFRKGDFKESQKAFRRSLELNRNNCVALNLYGRSLFELKSFSLASETFDQVCDRCQELNSDEPFYYSGLSYFKLGKREKAIARLEESISNFPSGPNATKAKEALLILQKN